ncbi:MAG: hypothetical protein JF615_13055 [Asticcacaulis sp.]|nr:hypothetical protein [Asticcacaulis sp.]
MMTPAIASDDQDGTVVPRVSPYWQVLAFLLALFVVVLNASSIWQNLTGRQDEGVTGFYTGQCGSDHFCTERASSLET